MRFMLLIQIFTLCMFLRASVGEEPARRADSLRSTLIELLASRSGGFMGLPYSVARVFATSLPNRFLRDNEAWEFAEKGPILPAIGGFHAAVQFRSPSDSTVSAWACYMGGYFGYCAIIEEAGRSARVVWSVDTLASLGWPRFEFVELTGDSLPELVLFGLVGLHMEMGGEIFSWDGTNWACLTAHGKEIGGYHWNYEPTGVGQTKRIVIYDTPTFDRAKGPLTRQVVEYDRARKALVWRAKEEVTPKQK